MYMPETSSSRGTIYSEIEHMVDEDHIGRLMHVKHPVIQLCQEQIDQLKFDTLSFEEELALIRDKRQNEIEHMVDEDHVGRLLHVKHPVIQLCQEQIDRLKSGTLSFEEELALIRDKRQREKGVIGWFRRKWPLILGAFLALFLLWLTLVIGALIGAALCDPANRSRSCGERCSSLLMEYPSIFSRLLMKRKCFESKNNLIF